MNLLEATREVVFRLLALLVGLAELADESRVFGEAGDVYAEEGAVADHHHRPEVGYPVKTAHVGGQKPELTRRIV